MKLTLTIFGKVTSDTEPFVLAAESSGMTPAEVARTLRSAADEVERAAPGRHAGTYPGALTDLAHDAYVGRRRAGSHPALRQMRYVGGPREYATGGYIGGRPR